MTMNTESTEGLTLGKVALLIQEVADSVEVLLDAAVFPDRILADDDDDADPRHARYLLAMRNLASAFGLDSARKSSLERTSS